MQRVLVDMDEVIADTTRGMTHWYKQHYGGDIDYEKMREGGKPWLRAVCAALLGGFFVSYAVEFTQIYIPFRDSGWEDVFTNSMGAAVGYFTFALVGEPILNSVSKIEARVEQFFTVRRALLLGLLYFSIWFVVSVPLQAE